MRSRLALASALFAATALGLAAMTPLANPDTFGHLAQGRAIAEAGGPPATDPFSCWRPAPQPWVNYEWLSDWLTWLVYSALGPNGLIALAMAMVAGSAAGLVLLAARLRGPRAGWLASLLLVASIPALRPRLSARPHLIALPFASLYLAVFTSEALFATRRRAATTVALLAGAQLLWANLHGSHLLGLAIAGLSALAALPDRRRAATLGVATGVLALASCVSPYGPAMAVTAVRHVFDPSYRAVVSEWQSLASEGWTWTTVSAGIACVGLALAGPRSIRGGVATRTWWAVAAAVAVGALRSLRFVEELLFLGSPLLGMALADVFSKALDRAAGRAVVVASMAGALALVAVGEAHDESGLALLATGTDTRFVPREAAQHLARELPGAHVLGSMPDSWYLMWAAPEVCVVVDGRVPFYGPAHVRAATDALAVEGALAPFVARHHIDAVLVQHTARDEVAALRSLATDPGFVRTWLDGRYAVYVDRALAARRGLATGALDALPATYDAAAILGAPDVGAVRAALGRLGSGPSARAFASFVRAELRLRPLARQAGWAGYRPPADAEERARVELARRELSRTLARAGRVPVVAAHAALVSALTCRLDEARALLQLARREGDVRETLFGQAEIDLRAGDDAALDALLAAARATPGGADDPWLAALDRERREHVTCQAP